MNVRLLLTLAGASLRTQTYFRLSLLSISAAYFRRRDTTAGIRLCSQDKPGRDWPPSQMLSWPVTLSLGLKDCVKSQKERLQGRIEGELKKGQGLTASARYF